ncbi:hypothetical protein BDN72DRAFT_866193 [Pluteus cervinus]|uniref:Uncharacterized protein n=1 Tax=Pluteus cervinus TaxID=181527 RepID=A0ACD2ZX93_9AGAR|nr:hypothetical protein BDN72DRAFT_866193 [Pluteus cervinus]
MSVNYLGLAYVSKKIWETWLDWAQGLPITQLQRLATDAFTNIMGWQGCRFRNLDRLREIVVSDDSSSHAFLDFVTADTELAIQSNSWDSISFPVLKKLTLRDCEGVEERLAVALAERAEHGHKLEELVFKDGHITDDAVTRLLMVVDKVTIERTSGL